MESEADAEPPARMRWLWWAVPLAGFVIVLTPFVLWLLSPMIGPPVYRARDAVFRVVDAETGQRIPNALVVVYWELTSDHSGWRRAAWLQVSEMRTDAEGLAHMPGWRRLRWPPTATLANGQPRVAVMADGYMPRAADDPERRDRLRVDWTSGWAGRDFPLTRERDVGAARDAFSDFAERVGDRFLSIRCDGWPQAPALKSSLFSTAASFASRGAWTRGSRGDPREGWWLNARHHGCDDPPLDSMDELFGPHPEFR